MIEKSTKLKKKIGNTNLYLLMGPETVRRHSLLDELRLLSMSNSHKMAVDDNLVSASLNNKIPKWEVYVHPSNLYIPQ